MGIWMRASAPTLATVLLLASLGAPAAVQVRRSRKQQVSWQVKDNTSWFTLGQCPSEQEPDWELADRETLEDTSLAWLCPAPDGCWVDGDADFIVGDCPYVVYDDDSEELKKEMGPCWTPRPFVCIDTSDDEDEDESPPEPSSPWEQPSQPEAPATPAPGSPGTPGAPPRPQAPGMQDPTTAGSIDDGSSGSGGSGSPFGSISRESAREGGASSSGVAVAAIALAVVIPMALLILAAALLLRARRRWQINRVIEQLLTPPASGAGSEGKAAKGDPEQSLGSGSSDGGNGSGSSGTDDAPAGGLASKAGAAMTYLGLLCPGSSLFKRGSGKVEWWEQEGHDDDVPTPWAPSAPPCDQDDADLVPSPHLPVSHDAGCNDEHSPNHVSLHVPHDSPAPSDGGSCPEPQ